jgi:mRNA interferase HigB
LVAKKENRKVIYALRFGVSAEPSWAFSKTFGFALFCANKINAQLFPIGELSDYLCTVRVIAKSTLRLFWTKHPDCEEQLKCWYKEVDEANWKNPRAIKKEYPSASFLSDNRVVFNIKGNHYRIVVRINYDYGVVWIRFVGTHAQYDKIDASNI